LPTAISHGSAGQDLERQSNRTETQNNRFFALLLRQFRVFIGSPKLPLQFDSSCQIPDPPLAADDQAGRVAADVLAAAITKANIPLAVLVVDISELSAAGNKSSCIGVSSLSDFTSRR
jgi:hypothetical protein